ncbi:MAG: hypothetical protein N3G21_00525 [Candidatus Hydrogenedentes bacterium]|nr:hypothetical protein [Candidatus Hydrogenedentota bacterium]
MKRLILIILLAFINIACISCNNSPTVIPHGEEPITKNVDLFPLPTPQRFGLVPPDTANKSATQGLSPALNTLATPSSSSQSEPIQQTSPGGFIAPEITWETPPGWQEASRKPMRVVTFTSKDKEHWECYVSIISSQAGGIEANIKRWAKQMLRDDLSIDTSQSPKIVILGQDTPLIEIDGTYTTTQGQSLKDYKLLGSICPLPDMTLFVKMVGPKDEVEKQKENFINFCKSLKLGN